MFIDLASMYNIQPLSRQPVYEQLIEQTERLLLTGDLKPSQQLPSVRSLSVRLSVNPNTIQKAYSELDRRGLLIAVPGRGCFVSDNASVVINESRRKRLEKLGIEIAELALAGVPVSDITSIVEHAYGCAETNKNEGADTAYDQD